MASVENISRKELLKRGYADIHDWLKKENHIYIGRECPYVDVKQSKWANPFSLKKYGRETCHKMYEEYIMKQPELLNSLHELKGKTLGCWCKPEICHGDILARLVRERVK